MSMNGAMTFGKLSIPVDQKLTPAGRKAAVVTVHAVVVTGLLQATTFVVPTGTTTIRRTGSISSASASAGPRIDESNLGHVPSQ